LSGNCQSVEWQLPTFYGVKTYHNIKIVPPFPKAAKTFFTGSFTVLTAGEMTDVLAAA